MIVSPPVGGIRLQRTQSVAPHVGAIVVGIILLAAAVAQWRAGTTSDLRARDA